eukprot:EG_transcript_5581
MPCYAEPVSASRAGPVAAPPAGHLHLRDTLRAVVSHFRPTRRPPRPTRELRFDVYPATPTHDLQLEAPEAKPVCGVEADCLQENVPSSARCRQWLGCNASSPEAALANLNEKKLLEARALCMERLRVLRQLNQTAQATLRTVKEFDGQDVEVARLELEFQQREAEIHRWDCRVRVAESELQRRGLLAPASARGAAGSPRKAQADGAK